jgi:single-stranded-DNA-specific exonuclease
MISVSNKEWSERKFSTNLVDKLSQDNNFSQILSKLIISRNFNDEEIHSIKHFKNINFSNVFKFNEDYKQSIDLVIKCIKNKEPICIFGDYDVDGSCSTALLLKFFKSINHPVYFYIPDRAKDGYGPNIKLFKEILKKNPKLIILVDCGSNSNDAINFLNERKINSLIIDHHQINKPYPKANSIINPKKDNGYMEYDYFCATTLTYFFLELLSEKIKTNFIIKDYLIFVLLATVCDVMPLRYVNRLIALKTLDEFNLDKITPIKKIYEFLNKSNKITINDLGYLLGPILNAGGRLGFSSYAVKLLSSNDEKEIDLIIKKLVELNEKRKSFEETILNNIDYKKIEVENENVIIYYHPSINEGLIGIIAARLKDIFNKPAIVITSSQNLLKGSARSISGFDIGLVFKNALDNKLIIKGGGHKMAAGFSLDKNNLKSFRKFIDNSYKKMCKNLNSNFLYESKISTSVFNSNFNVEINKLYPFGQGNTEPVFLFENLKIIKSKVLNNKHISNIFVSKSGFSIKSIAFNSINEAIGNYLLNYKKEINVIGYLNDNYWNNKKILQLVVKDLII